MTDNTKDVRDVKDITIWSEQDAKDHVLIWGRRKRGGFIALPDDGISISTTANLTNRQPIIRKLAEAGLDGGMAEKAASSIAEMEMLSEDNGARRIDDACRELGIDRAVIDRNIRDDKLISDGEHISFAAYKKLKFQRQQYVTFRELASMAAEAAGTGRFDPSREKDLNDYYLYLSSWNFFGFPRVDPYMVPFCDGNRERAVFVRSNAKTILLQSKEYIDCYGLTGKERVDKWLASPGWDGYNLAAVKEYISRMGERISYVPALTDFVEAVMGCADIRTMDDKGKEEVCGQLSQMAQAHFKRFIRQVRKDGQKQKEEKKDG